MQPTVRISPVSRDTSRTGDELHGSAPATVVCAECAREVTEAEAQAQRWGYWSDGVGELRPECSKREFGS